MSTIDDHFLANLTPTIDFQILQTQKSTETLFKGDNQTFYRLFQSGKSFKFLWMLEKKMKGRWAVLQKFSKPKPPLRSNQISRSIYILGHFVAK